MHVDCQWISKNLEALFCDGLSDAEHRLARAHIEGCAACHGEVQALNAIDPLIKDYFRQQLSTAMAPKRSRMSLVYAGAATVAATILLVLVVRTPSTDPGFTPSPSQSQVAPSASLETSSTIKADTPEGLREKPQPSAPAQPDRQAAAPVLPNAPDFFVTDPAGYSRTLADFRGYIFVMGVWSEDQPQAVSSLERLYRSFSSNTKLRFIGVSNERLARPADTTFPIVYNQGSQLLGAKPGEFIVVNEAGLVSLRGSLVNDVENLEQFLRKN